MNKVICIGRPTGNPEVRYSGEMAIARYTLAVDRKYKKEGEETADFIRCVAFGKAGEWAEKWLRKGVKIAVTGRIQTGSYADKEGRKVYTTDVVVEEHEFCESKGQNEGQVEERPRPSTDDEGFMNIPDGIEEDELPFQLGGDDLTGNYKHGMAGTRLHHIWKSMKQRCSNSNCINYKNYGAKGISVCDEWCDFENFAKWALSNGYSEELTLDRINANGNYEPSNCRWVTYKVQGNNRSNNRQIEMDGIIHTMAEWAEITGIKIATIHARLERGWNPEKALTIPPVVGRNQYNFRGVLI